jgi:integrase
MKGAQIMSIEKRSGNTWRFTITKDGQTYRNTFVGTEKKAINAHEAFKVDVLRGEIGINESMKFGELAQMVMDEYVKKKLKYASQQIYRVNYNYHILPFFGDMKLGKINAFLIQKFTNDMACKYMPNTVDKALSVLRTTLTFAVKWGFLKDNPYKFIEKPKKPSRKIDQLLSDEQIKTLFMAYEQDENLCHKSIFYLAIGCGLRNSEIRALTETDIDFINSTININKQDGYYLKDGKIIRGSVDPKTAGSKRKIYAPNFVMDCLKQYIKTLPELPTSKQLYYNPKTGRAVTKDYLTKYFSKVLSKNELPQIRFHDLRHMHATLSINNGGNITAIAKRMGHSQISTTLDVYTHAIESADKGTADILESVFKKANG